jgi:hypothetical protein
MTETRLTLKEFRICRTLSALFDLNNAPIPGLSLRSNPGLELANAFGVKPTNTLVATLLLCVSGESVA